MGINIIKRTSAHNTSYYGSRPLKFLVVHYTAGVTSKSGNAANIASYFATTPVEASADFICDDANIVQYNPDIRNRYCWAVGGSKYPNTRGGSKYGICTNANSISIEICSCNKKGIVTAANDSNWYFTDAAVNKARELVKYLMVTYNIPASNVIRHWDVTGKACPGIAGWIIDAGGDNKWKEFKASLTGSSTPTDATHGKIINEDWIWKFLSSKGVNDYVVAGIMGNLYAESGLRTNNLQNTYEKVLGMNDDKYTDAVDKGTYKNFANDGAGYGLCQWTYPTRKQGLLDYAKKTGHSIADLQVQGDWLWIELTRDYPGTLERIKKAETVDGASTVFLMEFERPAKMTDEVRKLRSSYGEAIYKRHHVDSKPTTPTTFKPYTVKVTADSLNVRSGPGTGYGTTTQIKKGEVYTIIAESSGAGANKWGKLKSGAGWISLDYCTKV